MPVENLKLRDVVVLALLKQSPRYGYEIKTIIDTVMSHMIDVSSGSLYYGIKRLAEQGYVEEASTERIGLRPERSVYQITQRGEDALALLLPRVIFPEARPVFPINLALYFFELIPITEQVRRLKMRREYLDIVDKMLAHFLESEDAPERTPSQWAIWRHHQRYIEMECSFINDLLRTIADDSAYELDQRDHDEVLLEFNSLLSRIRKEDSDHARRLHIPRRTAKGKRVASGG